MREGKFCRFLPCVGLEGDSWAMYRQLAIAEWARLVWGRSRNSRRMDMARSGTPSAKPAPWPSDDDIRLRAYAVFERRGSSHGRALDDWLQAERELRGER